MMSAAFTKYLPKIMAYTEIAQAGGCQVIDEYICDSDGNKIKKLSSTCPEGDLNIDPNEVVNFVLQTYNNKKTEDMKSFVQFIKTNYVNNGFTLELNTIKDFPYLFFVKVTRGSDIKYFRYYYDDRQTISNFFQVPIREVAFNMRTSDLRMINAMKDPIPVYNNNLTP
jgi:hypothetical protein